MSDAHLARTFIRTLDSLPQRVTVRLCGWVVEHEGERLVMQDSTGTATAVLSPGSGGPGNLRRGDVVELVGELQDGGVVRAGTVTVHNRAHLPDPSEVAPLSRYSYLRYRNHEAVDLVRRINRAERVARSYLFEEGFLEIRTPLLWRPIQEYAEPEFHASHIHRPGMGYSLLQSPMPPALLAVIGGLDRVFSFSLCVRWEGTNYDPRKVCEFTHLNMAMSFTTLEDSKRLMEGLSAPLIHALTGEQVEMPFPRIQFDEALRLYSSDTPDFRYRQYLRPTIPGERLAYARGELSSLIIPYALPTGLRAQLSSILRERYGEGYGLLHVDENGTEAIGGDIGRGLDVRHIVREYGVRPPATLVALPGTPERAHGFFEKIIVQLHPVLDGSPVPRFAFVWVDGIPYLTDPRAEDVASRGSFHMSRSVLGRTTPASQADPRVRVLSHDLILNGLEIGGGGEKEHRAEELAKNLEIAQVDDPAFRFGYHLDALTRGAPPMLNCVIGWERFLWKVLETESLHDVMFLPKDNSGRCPVSGAPLEIARG